MVRAKSEEAYWVGAEGMTMGTAEAVIATPRTQRMVECMIETLVDNRMR